MTQTTNPSKGTRVTYEAETTFGTQTAAAQKDVRIEGNPDGALITGPTTTALHPKTLYADAHEFDAPVQITPSVEGALSFTAHMHQAAAAGGESFLQTALKSLGLTQTVSANDTTTTGVPTVGAITMTAAEMAVGRGCYIHNDNDSNLYIPVLQAGTSTTVVTPAMDLAQAPSAAQEVTRAATFYPGSPAATSTWLTFEHDTQAAGSSNKFEGVAKGCALASIDAFEIQPNVFPALKMTFNAATVQSGSIAALGSNSFQDSANVKAVDPATFYCEFATADTAGGIARAVIPLIKATVNIGRKSKPTPAVGGSTCPGGIGGHFSFDDEDGPTIEIEMMWDIQMITDWELAGGVEKHIAFVQPSSSKTNLGWSFTAPSCRLISQPVIDHYSEGYRKITAKYRMGPAGYDGTLDSDAGNQPWYWITPTSEAA